MSETRTVVQEWHRKVSALKHMLISFLVRHSVLLLLAAFVLLGVWVLDDYGMSLDEGIQRLYAVITLDYLLGDDDAILMHHDKFYGMVFEVPLLLLERVLGLEDTRDVHLTRHIVTHLFFLVGGFFCYLLAYRLFDNRMLAVLAMLIFLMHPRLYAHSFSNSKDIPFLSMFMICLFLTHRALGNGNIWRFVVLGIATGILTNLRIMGVTLLVAVLAMQLLDLLQAHDNSGRRRVLAGAAVFVMSTALTVYVSMPSLWTDPIGRSTEWWVTLSQHPTRPYQLFRGEMFQSGAVHLPEYVPVWFSITTSPMTLAMGGMGILAVLRGGATRFGDVFRNTRLRFGFLLVGCFVLPIVAVIVLSANVNNGWRQMYFIYAPFCMLAVFGLHWTMSRVKSARLKPGIYGAVGAGIAASVVSMASIHPHQHVYFNFLVDRTTPEHLRYRYDIDYWGPSLLEALEFLLERYPSSDLSVRVPNRFIDRLNWMFLPASDRSRVSMNRGAGDFLVTNYRDSWISGGVLHDVPSSSIYDLNIYGSTVLTVTDLSDVDDEVIDAYKDIYSRTTSHGAPLIRAEFDVHLDDDDLVYVKEDCNAADIAMEFNLHMDYPSGSDAAAQEKSNRLRAERFKFSFYQHGIMLEGTCIAVVPVPGRSFSRIWTAQDLWGSREKAWEAEYSAAADIAATVRELQQRGVEPAIRSVFDVYPDNDSLVYAKPQCSDENRETRFFMHVRPKDASELLKEKKETGFDNLDFNLREHGGQAYGGCFATVELPAYEIASISTGQYTPDGHVWSGEYSTAAVDAAATVRELQQRGVEPAIRSVFDVYPDNDSLVYAKSTCAEQDYETRFFLHVRPADEDDLPEERKESRYDNLDFNLREHGGQSDGGCFATVELPEYQIASISTGQYTADGQVWSEEYNAATADAAAAARELQHRGAQPAIRSVFDVYVDEGRLVYVKEQCSDEDRETRFFLHVRPADEDDLPEERKESRYDNLDFNLREHGGESDGICFAAVQLPEYQIASISTGQYTSDGQVWSEELEIREE